MALCSGMKRKDGGARLACLSGASPQPGQGHTEAASASLVWVQGQSKPELGRPQNLRRELQGTFKGALALLSTLKTLPQEVLSALMALLLNMARLEANLQ